MRVATFQAWAAPPAPPAAAAPAVTGPSFQTVLAQAVDQTAAPGSYPHLRGDLDADPEMLARLERLAAARGETWNVTSGLRSHAEQQALWDRRASNPYPVARPGTSRHEHGRAADVTINGRAIQDVVPRAELLRAGLVPLAGDAVHVELAR